MTTDVGKKRENNEDNFYLNGTYKRVPDELRYEKSDLIYKRGIFAVCDGMGGEEYGEKASLFAVETLKEYQEKEFSFYIQEYIENANQKICDFMEENNGVRSGTTLALLYIENHHAVSYNVGDSRVYLFRNGTLTQLSEDHTGAARMIKMGVLTKEQAKKHRDRNLLTQYLGIFPEELIIQAHKSEVIELLPNDIFLLCSDGLTDMLEDDEIATILEKEKSVAEYAIALKEAALANGGKDNVTVGIIKNMEKPKGILEKFFQSLVNRNNK